MARANYISELRFVGTVDEQSYLHNLPVVRHLSQVGELKFSGNVTFFVGENGTGKSTLLEAIAVAHGFNPEGGSINFRFSTNATHSALWEHLVLGKRDYPRDGFFLRAESLYNAATYIDELDKIAAPIPSVIESYGGVSLHNQSHGESLLSIVHNRFQGNGLYLLDEPEAALSPMRQLTLLAEIHALVKKGSQFIIATHSPILMAYPGAEIFCFSEEGMRSLRYDETEHFQVTKQFLNQPDRMLNLLFSEEET